MIAPVLKKDEVSEIVLTGFQVKEVRKNDFTINAIVIETFFGEDVKFEIPEELKEMGFTNDKQQHELFELDYNYKHLNDVALGKVNAENVVEVLLADLYVLLVNDIMYENNFQSLSFNGNIRYF